MIARIVSTEHFRWIRAAARNVAITAVIAACIAALWMAATFAANFGLSFLRPDHYRAVMREAARDGTMAATFQQTFNRDRGGFIYGQNDCIILGTLVMPVISRLSESVSPRMVAPGRDPGPAAAFSPVPHCRALASAVVTPDTEDRPVTYYHQYIHGDATAAAFLLAVLPMRTASLVLLAGTYALLAVTALIAGWRMLANGPRHDTEAAGFFVLATAFTCFDALPVFAPSFSFGPTDLLIAAFILLAFLAPITRSRSRLILTTASFGALLAILEFLTGGLPVGLIVLITVIALQTTKMAAHERLDSLTVGVSALGAAAVACFVIKVLMVWALWGENPLRSFVDPLLEISVFDVRPMLSTNLQAGFKGAGIDVGQFGQNVAGRAVLGMAMLGYSAFVLGWGSHVLGALLAVVPTGVAFACCARIVSSAGRYDAATRVTAAMLGLAALVPVVWFLAFSTHTLLHSFFMVRVLVPSIAIAAMLALLWYGAGKRT